MNVWLALTYAGHVHHPTAKEWFQELGPEARLCFCRFTQLSLLRLLTTEAVMGRDEVLTQTEAWLAYDRWAEDPRVVFLHEPLGLERAFRELSRRGRSSPKQWADAYLASFALVSGIRLVTFGRVQRSKVRDPLILG